MLHGNFEGFSYVNQRDRNFLLRQLEMEQRQIHGSPEQQQSQFIQQMQNSPHEGAPSPMV